MNARSCGGINAEMHGQRWNNSFSRNLLWGLQISYYLVRAPAKLKLGENYSVSHFAQNINSGISIKLSQ